MVMINPDEITSIIKEKLQNYESKLEVKNVGTVLEVADGISRIYGLSDAMSSELVEFGDGHGTLGITLNLEEDNVGVVILGDYTHIKEGMTVITTGRIASVPVGELFCKESDDSEMSCYTFFGQKIGKMQRCIRTGG